MKMIDLFCGTKSMANAFEARGHRVFTSDFDAQFAPDLEVDILDFNIPMLPIEFRNPDVVWASPPCQTFSVASIGTHWTYPIYTPKTEAAKRGIKILKKTISIIEELNPKYYFIENPRGVMRKMKIMNDLRDRKTVTYCQYGDDRMKPTDIWTSCAFWEPRPMCKNGDPCHVSAPRGAKTGTQGLKGSIDRSRIPANLCHEIVSICELGMK